MLPSATVLLSLLLLYPPSHARVHQKREARSVKCVDPPDLKDQLAEWLSEAAEGVPGEDYSPPLENEEDIIVGSPLHSDSICELPLDTGTHSNLMQRSLCPWKFQASFEEDREPKTLHEASCLCRRSRGSPTTYCMPIKRDTPILRRLRCDPHTGVWEYKRAMVSMTVGCHSVLPRTQRHAKLVPKKTREFIET